MLLVALMKKAADGLAGPKLIPGTAHTYPADHALEYSYPAAEEIEPGSGQFRIVQIDVPAMRGAYQDPETCALLHAGKIHPRAVLNDGPIAAADVEAHLASASRQLASAHLLPALEGAK